MTSWLTFQYTLTETHVGGSGAVGATDLPIAREATTDLPFLPDTALKGVARDWAERLKDEGKLSATDLRNLLGWVPKKGEDTGETPSSVGALSFTQGHLLLYPLRSLRRPFVYATSALLLGRMARLARAFGLDGAVDSAKWKGLLADADGVRVASKNLDKTPLALEGTMFGKDKVAHDEVATALAKWIADRLPEKETETAAWIRRDLVVLPDADLVALLRAAPPVRARVSLNDHKTTTGEGGNLWYEEMLPSDCLFWSVVSLQPRRKDLDLKPQMDVLLRELGQTQLGGGESTGHGRCWWFVGATGGKD